LISLYTATVPAFRQAIAATRGVLAKAAAFAAEHGRDPATLVDARLIADMLPLNYQVQSIATHSVRALDSARAASLPRTGRPSLPTSRQWTPSLPRQKRLSPRLMRARSTA